MLDLIPSRDPPPPDLDTASPALLRRRGLATLLDAALCYFTFDAVLIASVIGLFPEWSVANTDALFVNGLLFLVPIYLVFVFVLEWRFARTPGKVWQGLMVATPDGHVPDLEQSAVRNVARYLDFLPALFLLGWLLARRSPTGQRIGDRLAGTVVVEPGAPTRSFEDRPD